MAAIKKIWRNFHVMWRDDHILQTSKETCWMYSSFFKFHCHSFNALEVKEVTLQGSELAPKKPGLNKAK